MYKKQIAFKLSCLSFILIALCSCGGQDKDFTTSDLALFNLKGHVKQIDNGAPIIFNKSITFDVDGHVVESKRLKIKRDDTDNIISFINGKNEYSVSIKDSVITTKNEDKEDEFNHDQNGYFRSRRIVWTDGEIVDDTYKVLKTDDNDNWVELKYISTDELESRGLISRKITYYTDDEIKNKETPTVEDEDDEPEEECEMADNDSIPEITIDDLTPGNPVDLGLSVKWASHNVGASSPEEYGDYYAWGETTTKDEYNWDNYIFSEDSGKTFTKYKKAKQEDGSLTRLEPIDDVATVKWGEEWRMPTVEEADELIDMCSWKVAKLNGIKGFMGTGSNGNSIFLPATGYYDDNGLVDVGEIGTYSTSELCWKNTYYVIMTEKNEDPSPTFTKGMLVLRFFGTSIRPVQQY